MSDIKMYDILGQFNGLSTKSMPVSSSQTEPLYESVEPLDSVTESVAAMESKFAMFKENMVAEKTLRKSADPKDDSENIDSADATIQNLLTKARFSRPGAKTDLEAIVYHIAKQDEELERAKTAEEEDRQLIKKAQAVTDQMNNRFKKLNAKVAAGQITAQDKAVAQAAQQIEKDADAAKDAVAANPNAPVQNIAEPVVPAEEPATQPQPPQIQVTQVPAAQPAQPQQPLNVVQPPISTNQNQNKQKGKVGGSSITGSGVTGTKAPNFRDIDAELNKEEVAESLTEESRYPEGTPEAGKYNWSLLARAWKNKLPYVDLNFGLKDVRMTDAQMYAALATWKSNGVDFSAGGDPTIDNALSSRENLELFFRGRKFKEFLSAYPKVKEKALKATQGAKPGVTARVNPNVPPGTQEDLPLAEQNLGKNTMTKPNSIIEAVRSVEYKKLKEAAKPDFLDLDKDGDTDEPMKQAAKDAKKHEPAEVDKDAVAKRKRLQALKDKQEDERAEKGDYDDEKSSKRVVKGRAYGGAAQKDDEDKDEVDEGKMKEIYTDMMDQATKKGYSSHKQFTPADYDELGKKHNISGKDLAVALGHKKASQVEESGLQYYTGKKKYGKEGMTALSKAGRNGASEEELGRIKDKYKKEDVELNEKAVSKQQQKFMGMVHAVQKGKMKAPSKLIAKTAKGMSDKAAHDFAATKHKGLPTKVTEGKEAIRNHPIYTTKEAWDHYAEELAEQEMMEQSMMEAPAVNVQQELDEIAKLAGLPTRACKACNCAPCKCDEGLEAMAPSDSSSPLTHAELDESTRKHFKMAADMIKALVDAGHKEKALEKAKIHDEIFARENPRYDSKKFFAACGLEECGSMPTAVIVGEDKCPTCDCAPCKCDEGMMEAEVEEGNEFSGALAKARAAGSKEFEVDGKKYTVKEDINLNVSAVGEEDVVNLIRKLSGMEAIKTVTDKISAMSGEACGACGSSPCGCEAVAETVEDGPKERDVEYTNSPREEQAGADAAFPGGTDLNRPKKSYSDKPFRGDNPMAVSEAKEEELWKAYESIINDVKA